MVTDVSVSGGQAAGIGLAKTLVILPLDVSRPPAAISAAWWEGGTMHAW